MDIVCPLMTIEGGWGPPHAPTQRPLVLVPLDNDECRGSTAPQGSAVERQRISVIFIHTRDANLPALESSLPLRRLDKDKDVPIAVASPYSVLTTPSTPRHRWHSCRPPPDPANSWSPNAELLLPTLTSQRYHADLTRTSTRMRTQDNKDAGGRGLRTMAARNNEERSELLA
ncbi:hypothetical protein D9619_008599 [Psilocybe cf. subviscida]|uniref:Uncharacterized protein n=1 Tax=Psilocybe cf. subviscida TaxID=2480587 RepID=A0A8H5F1D6_9AGAR|nr:hypothetical protein D9619_008599 [Psilocybe cf. subviscida]